MSPEGSELSIKIWNFLGGVSLWEILDPPLIGTYTAVQWPRIAVSTYRHTMTGPTCSRCNKHSHIMHIILPADDKKPGEISHSNITPIVIIKTSAGYSTLIKKVKSMPPKRLFYLQPSHHFTFIRHTLYLHVSHTSVIFSNYAIVITVMCSPVDSSSIIGSLGLGSIIFHILYAMPLGR